MRKVFLAIMAFLVTEASSLAQSNASAGIHQTSIRTPSSKSNGTIADLMQGNKRFVKNHLQHPHQDTIQVHKISGTQHPKAIVLTCADSRVAPEIIFDQGLGDL